MKKCKVNIFLKRKVRIFISDCLRSNRVQIFSIDILPVLPFLVEFLNLVSVSQFVEAAGYAQDMGIFFHFGRKSKYHVSTVRTSSIHNLYSLWHGMFRYFYRQFYAF